MWWQDYGNEILNYEIGEMWCFPQKFTPQNDCLLVEDLMAPQYLVSSGSSSMFKVP